MAFPGSLLRLPYLYLSSASLSLALEPPATSERPLPPPSLRSFPPTAERSWLFLLPCTGSHETLNPSSVFESSAQRPTSPTSRSTATAPTSPLRRRTLLGPPTAGGVTVLLPCFAFPFPCFRLHLFFPCSLLWPHHRKTAPPSGHYCRRLTSTVVGATISLHLLFPSS